MDEAQYAKRDTVECFSTERDRVREREREREKERERERERERDRERLRATGSERDRERQVKRDRGKEVQESFIEVLDIPLANFFINSQTSQVEKCSL